MVKYKKDSARVSRGGSWNYNYYNCAVSNVYYAGSDGGYAVLGFRVCRSIGGKNEKI